MNRQDTAARIETVGTHLLRYGLVAILLMIGATKWTAAEAEAIHPWVSNSPLLSWIDHVAGIQTASEIIGTFEIIAALLIAVRRWEPRATVVGSGMAVLMFLVTLSFLVTTPNQTPDAQGFLMKDFFLLGTAIWSAGEALQAAGRRRSHSLPATN